MSKRMLERFVRLCEIASPTGSERAVADDVVGELRTLGVEIIEDDSAAPARAGAGNLIARVPGTGEGWVLFCAHLDTVPHEAPVEVAFADGVYRSAGETILGADNKAAVTVLVELAARAAVSPPRVGLELVFTVAEEDGLRGAKELDVGSLRPPLGFLFSPPPPTLEMGVGGPPHE
ncbi:MAG: M20/M25/M40 family metallo-hydrolase, partial [Solirubrobacterales bacterium]